MNKTQLKNFAIWARKKLIADIELKASLIGISEDGIQQPSNASTSDLQVFEINGNITKLSGKDIQKRKTIVDKIRQKEEDTDYKTAFNYIVEEVAYTWFNRLIAIRYMELKDYLPSRIRVLSSIDDTYPEILKNYLDADLNLNEKEIEKIEQYKDEYKIDDLFAFLFLKQCNALNKILPELFDNSLDYMEILLRIDFTSKDSVVYKLVNEVDKDNFEDVEVVGWLYQYYNTEEKDRVINLYKGDVKKDDIPFATQLFTPDWVARYMVDNTLGRYWIERNPNSNLINELEFFVKSKKEPITYIDEKIEVEDITFLEPCMGSGHILVYAFEVFLKIYEECGDSPREAVEKILNYNLYGLDIDKRAYQLSYFSLMMKGRQYDRRIFLKDINLNIMYYKDYKGINVEDTNLQELLKVFKDASNLGSIININKDLDIEKLIQQFKIENNEQVSIENYNNTKIYEILQQAKFLNKKYDIVCTNPPYLAKMNANLKNYVTKHYKDYKGDLYSVFIYKNLQFCKQNGYCGYMSPYTWMFIKTYEPLRNYILNNKNIVTLVQMEYSAFEEATVPLCSFIVKNNKENEKGLYFRLEEFKGGMQIQGEKVLNAIKNDNCSYFYETSSENFSKIPGSPIAYWASEKIFDIFENSKSLGEIALARQGIIPGNTDVFLKLWYEVDLSKIGFNHKEYKDINEYGKKWFIYNKGGKYRKWYGNIEHIINMYNNGYDIKYSGLNKNYRLREPELYFKEALTWSKISSSYFSSRYMPVGCLFDIAGCCIFNLNNNINFILAFTNSIVNEQILAILSPTLNYEVDNIKNLPIRFEEKDIVDIIVKENISISKNDWNSFETSYDFLMNPLLEHKGENIEQSYIKWKEYCNNAFNKLKENEEKLNEIFIKIYGLEDELTPYVEDKDITITKIFDNKEDITENIKGNKYILTKKDVIKNFISYSVGCMLGRYSLDIDGLAFAGGEWNNNKYNTFKPVEKNCLLILEEEIPELKEYDIVNKFKEFVKVTFGKETLEENLQFIADALEIKGKDKYDVIRNYFVKDFYKEHTQMYKCPIYWLFDAGKQNSFKALMYLHRYNTDTVGMINVEFLQKVQEAYERFKAVEEKAKIIEEYDKKLTEIKPYLEKMAHISNLRIDLDLDDGVKVNYKKLQTGKDGKNLEILAKIK